VRKLVATVLAWLTVFLPAEANLYAVAGSSSSLGRPLRTILAERSGDGAVLRTTPAGLCWCSSAFTFVKVPALAETLTNVSTLTPVAPFLTLGLNVTGSASGLVRRRSR
jgi:hypothetical protein